MIIMMLLVRGYLSPVLLDLYTSEFYISVGAREWNEKNWLLTPLVQLRWRDMCLFHRLRRLEYLALQALATAHRQDESRRPSSTADLAGCRRDDRSRYPTVASTHKGS